MICFNFRRYIVKKTMLSTQWHLFDFEYILEKEGLSYAQLLFILYTFNHMLPKTDGFIPADNWWQWSRDRRVELGRV